MTKVGRKRALTPQLEREMLGKIALFEKVRRECGPAALCRDYHISATSLRSYRLRGYKDGVLTGTALPELCGTEVEALLTSAPATSTPATAPPTQASDLEPDAQSVAV